MGAPQQPHALLRRKGKRENYIYSQVPEAWGMDRLVTVFTATVVETTWHLLQNFARIVIFGPFLKVIKIRGWHVL